VILINCWIFGRSYLIERFLKLRLQLDIVISGSRFDATELRFCRITNGENIRLQ